LAVAATLRFQNATAKICFRIPSGGDVYHPSPRTKAEWHLIQDGFATKTFREPHTFSHRAPAVTRPLAHL